MPKRCHFKGLANPPPTPKHVLTSSAAGSPALPVLSNPSCEGHPVPSAAGMEVLGAGIAGDLLVLPQTQSFDFVGANPSHHRRYNFFCELPSSPSTNPICLLPDQIQPQAVEPHFSRITSPLARASWA